MDCWPGQKRTFEEVTLDHFATFCRPKPKPQSEQQHTALLITCVCQISLCGLLLQQSCPVELN